MSFGMPLISAEQEPHLPALQFQRHGEIVRLLRLNLMNGIEHDHAFAKRFVVVVLELAAPRVAAPDLKVGLVFISSPR